MDTTSSITTTTKAADARLRPLRLALFVSGIAPWLAVEKVFMTELGFTPALVAAMAAAYAAVVPVLEVPAGVLADRWSRRGVLMLAQGAALLSAAIAALSHGVGGYIASAMSSGSTSRCSPARSTRSSTTPCSRRPAPPTATRRPTAGSSPGTASRSPPAPWRAA